MPKQLKNRHSCKQQAKNRQTEFTITPSPGIACALASATTTEFGIQECLKLWAQFPVTALCLKPFRVAPMGIMLYR